jgi:hypothetical protein
MPPDAAAIPLLEGISATLSAAVLLAGACTTSRRRWNRQLASFRARGIGVSPAAMVGVSCAAKPQGQRSSIPALRKPSNKRSLYSTHSRLSAIASWPARSRAIVVVLTPASAR